MCGVHERCTQIRQSLYRVSFRLRTRMKSKPHLKRLAFTSTRANGNHPRFRLNTHDETSSPSKRALFHTHRRTLYSNNTGKIALQNVGRNVSGSSARVLASVLAPFLCVAREICDSLSVFAMARCASVVMSARGGVRSGRRARRRVRTLSVDLVPLFLFFFADSNASYLVLDLEDARGDW